MSYHFPPALTAGSLRWQKLLPLLEDRGWTCDVLTLDPELIERPDWDRMNELPRTTRVFAIRPGISVLERFDRWRPRRSAEADQRIPTLRPPPTGDVLEPLESLPPDQIRWSVTRHSLRRIYNTLLLHQSEASWARSATRIGRKLLAQGRYAAVISSGPPHGVHRAGIALSRAARVPLVIDFRDPWSARRRLPEAFASPLYFHMAEREERAALDACSLAIVTTDAIGDALRSVGTRCPVLTVMNGVDDQVFNSPLRDRFVIAYAGALYLDRDPRPLFNAVAQVVRATGAGPRELEVRLIGPVDHYGGRSTTALAEEAGIGAFVRIDGPLPRGALAQRLVQASVLVSFPQDSTFALPSKIFEYMAFEAWLLVIAAPGTPSATLMASTDAVLVTPGPEAVAKIRDALEHWFLAFRAGVRPTFLSQRDRFSRRAQARVLADALEMFRPGASRK